MPPPRPVLAATDFSTHARHAAERAARLARESGAGLTLMHVLPGGALQALRLWLGSGHASEQQLQAEARHRLQQLAQELQLARHWPVRPVYGNGAVPDELLHEANALDAALRAVGARGAGVLRRLAIGTTAERLLRRTTRPLLVVRRTPRPAYRRVLLALDFSPRSAPALALAQQFAPGARFHLLNAFEVPFEEKLQFAGVDARTIEHYRRHARAAAGEAMHALARAAGLKPRHWEPCIVEGDASLRIVEQEQALGCELVVLGKHGQSAGEERLLGSVTKHVLAEGSADVLVSTARVASPP